MSPIVKEWLCDLYDTAIEDAEKAMADESNWAKGRSADEVLLLHDDYMATSSEYVSTLKDLRARVDSM